MRRFDILSEAPKSLIFNEDSNKTVFGGSLSLIYLLITLGIAIFYFVNYFANDKYNVEYGFFQEVLDWPKQQEMLASDEYNPEIEFSYAMVDDSLNLVNDRFVVMNLSSGQSMPDKFKKRLSDMELTILYRCDDQNCTMHEEDPNNITLILEFKGFRLDHQGEVPLVQDKFLGYSTRFYLRNPAFIVYTWKIIKYVDNLGISQVINDMFKIDSNNEYIGGTIKEHHQLNLKDINEDALLPDIINGTYYRLLGMALINLDFNSYDEYKRTKISFLDVIADICSLSMTIFSGFIFIFSNYFSSSFDNYQIMEKILSKEKNEIINKSINDKEDINKKDIVEKSKPKSESELIEMSNADEIPIKIPENKAEEMLIEKVDNDEKHILPRLRFFDYIWNYIQTDRCCKTSKKQLLISSCNDAISKYYTVEDIIYNQMRLENLFRDYKWNDPNLSSINSIESVSEIKKNI